MTLFTFIIAATDGYGLSFFSCDHHWCLYFGPLASKLPTIWLLPAWGLWLLLWLQCETQNESDSTTRALQSHFPTGRSWGKNLHRFSPEAVGSGEETNKRVVLSAWYCVLALFATEAPLEPWLLYHIRIWFILQVQFAETYVMAQGIHPHTLQPLTWGNSLKTVVRSKDHKRLNTNSWCRENHFPCRPGDRMQSVLCVNCV